MLWTNRHRVVRNAELRYAQQRWQRGSMVINEWINTFSLLHLHYRGLFYYICCHKFTTKLGNLNQAYDKRFYLQCFAHIKKLIDLEIEGSKIFLHIFDFYCKCGAWTLPFHLTSLPIGHLKWCLAHSEIKDDQNELQERSRSAYDLSCLYPPGLFWWFSLKSPLLLSDINCSGLLQV